jgi:hypothetical protein
MRELIGLKTWIVLCSLALMAGCGGLLNKSDSKRDSEFTVVPFSNSSVLALDGKDVNRIMEIAGFTPPQIWELGEDLHNALLQSGGAKMRQGKKQVEVIYAIQGDLVWITTRSRGLFVYDAKGKQFNLGPGTAQGSPGSP